MRIVKRKWIQYVLAGAVAVGLGCNFGGQRTLAATVKPVLDNVQSLGHWEVNGDKKTYVLKSPEILQSASSSSILKKAAALPSQYSLVTAGKSTSVKDQGNFGACWAFGAMASLESNLISTGHASTSVDLSERHLAWFTFHGSNGYSVSKYAGKDHFVVNGDDAYNTGGNRTMAVASLARKYGAVDESKAKYNTTSMGSLSTSLQTSSAIRLKDAVYLPEVNTYNNYGTWTKRNTAAVGSIKDYIYSKGAVSVGIYADSNLGKETGGYNAVNTEAKTESYFCNSNNVGANHEVTIVGWDDSYSKENFRVKPSSNGAWIVKNSYGTETSGNGYFYLSYEDRTFSEPTGYVAENTTYKATGSSHTYGNVYQYDGVGIGDGLYVTTSRVNAANIYTARGNETIRGIGTYTSAANTKVSVRIYTGVTAKKPMSGTKKYSHTFTLTNAGYHTLDLGSSYFALPKGTRYSVVFTTYYTSGSKTYYFVPFEMQETWGSMGARIVYSSGQSYYDFGSLNSSGWKNSGGAYFTTDAKAGNALMKVYTNTRNQTISTSATTYKKKYGQKSFNVKAKRTSGIGSLSYSSNNKSVATVSSKGTVKIKGVGKAVISVKVSGNKEYPAVTKKLNVLVAPKKATLKSVSSPSKKALKVKWKKVSKATGYRIDIATNKSFTKGKKSYKVRSRSTLTKTITKLKRKKTYYIRVRSYKKSLGTNVYSDYSKIKKKKTK
ncbi:MAG: lectin like domain-containing protein [Anaerostipes sp.]|jgi:C1A family cysteine protease